MLEIIIRLLNMIPYMVCAVPLIALFRVVSIARMKKHGIKTTFLHELGVILFSLFLAGLASQTVIPKIEFGNVPLGIVNGYGGINLIPFMVFRDTYVMVIERGNIGYFLMNSLGNVLLFVPFGFCIPVLFNRMTFKKVILIGFLSSLFIELVQLLQPRGTDVDDLWINSLGVCLGYAVYKLCGRFMKFGKFRVNV